MTSPRARASRVFTVSFPEPLAQQVEETARAEHRNISELFREAFRAYRIMAHNLELERLRPVPDPSAPPITEDDIVAWTKEYRAEMYQARMAALDRHA